MLEGIFPIWSKFASFRGASLIALVFLEIRYFFSGTGDEHWVEAGAVKILFRPSGFFIFAESSIEAGCSNQTNQNLYVCRPELSFQENGN